MCAVAPRLAGSTPHRHLWLWWLAAGRPALPVGRADGARPRAAAAADAARTVWPPLPRYVGGPPFWQRVTAACSPAHKMPHQCRPRRQPRRGSVPAGRLLCREFAQPPQIPLAGVPPTELSRRTAIAGGCQSGPAGGAGGRGGAAAPQRSRPAGHVKVGGGGRRGKGQSVGRRVAVGGGGTADCLTVGQYLRGQTQTHAAARPWRPTQPRPRVPTGGRSGGPAGAGRHAPDGPPGIGAVRRRGG